MISTTTAKLPIHTVKRVKIHYREVPTMAYVHLHTHVKNSESETTGCSKKDTYRLWVPSTNAEFQYFFCRIRKCLKK